MSWHETDLLTQLPIKSGDKVRLLLLINQQKHVYSKTDIRHNEIEFHGRGMTNVHEIWSPILPPIAGEYDDYGSIENIEPNIQENLMHDFLKKSFIFSDSEELDRVEEYEKNSKTQTLTAYLKSIERGYGCCHNLMNQLTELGAVMILEDVYQRIMQYNPVIMHSDWSNKDKPIHLYMKWQDSIKLNMEEWYNKTFDANKLIKSALNEDERINALSNLFQMSECRVFDDYRSYCGRQFNKILTKKSKEQVPIDSESVQELLKAFKEVIILDGFMQSVRKFYTPQCGKGSQDDDSEPYLLLNKCVESVFNKREQRYREENEDDSEKLDENGYSEYMLEHNKKQLEKVAK